VYSSKQLLTRQAETRPEGVNKRLQTLLDRQDRGKILTRAERQEAEGLVDLAELLALLRLRAQRVGQQHGL
jgi:hypothetical protein